MVHIVIMAHGRQERLPELGSLPKHQLSLGHETILERTVRLAHEFSEGRLRRCAPAHRRTLSEPPCATLIEGMRAAAFEEPGPQLFLLGDVVWSRASLERVITDKRDAPQFYGKNEPNLFTGKMYGELYAVRVDPAELLPHLGCASLWALKAALRAPMVLIADWTDDIDTPEDLHERLPKLCEFVENDK
jgi:hypothetical protein